MFMNSSGQTLDVVLLYTAVEECVLYFPPAARDIDHLLLKQPLTAHFVVHLLTPSMSGEVALNVSLTPTGKNVFRDLNV